jgi:hypothetical protein
MDSDRQQVMARMDTMGMEYRDMGRDTALHDDSEALRVAIIAGARVLYFLFSFTSFLPDYYFYPKPRQKMLMNK